METFYVKLADCTVYVKLADCTVYVKLADCTVYGVSFKDSYPVILVGANNQSLNVIPRQV